MGNYTELILGCALDKDTPQKLVQTLDYVINGEDKKPKPDKPETPVEFIEAEQYVERTLPETELREYADQLDLYSMFFSESYYFGGVSVEPVFMYDSVSKLYYLSTRANCKYGLSSILEFLDTIKPYVRQGSGFEHDIYAYVQHESDPFPTIYSIDGKYTIEEDKEGNISCNYNNE